MQKWVSAIAVICVSSLTLAACDLYGVSTGVDLDDATPPSVQLIGANIVNFGDRFRIEHGEDPWIGSVRESFFVAVQADDPEGVKLIHVPDFTINIVCVNAAGVFLRIETVSGQRGLRYEDTDLTSSRTRLTGIFRVLLGNPRLEDECGLGAHAKQMFAAVQATAASFGNAFADPVTATFYRDFEIPRPPDPEPEEPPEPECVPGGECTVFPIGCQDGFGIVGEFVCVQGRRECRSTEDYCGGRGQSADCGLPDGTSGCAGHTFCMPAAFCNPQPDAPTRSYCDPDLSCNPIGCYRPGEQMTKRDEIRGRYGC